MPHRKAILSVALVCMLVLVVIGPNQASYHAQLIASVLNPIFAVTEFGSTWSFFAPDPSTVPLRLEWEVLGPHGEILRDGFFPEAGYPYFMNERQTRRIAIARFFYFFDERQMNVWSSWLCRSNPDAAGFRLWKSYARVPDLYKVQAGEESLADMRYEDRKSIGNVFCSDLPKAEARPVNEPLLPTNEPRSSNEGGSSG